MKCSDALGPRTLLCLSSSSVVLLCGCSVLRYKGSGCISATAHNMTPTHQRQRRNNGGVFMVKDFVTLKTTGTFLMCGRPPSSCVAHLAATHIHCWSRLMVTFQVSMAYLCFSLHPSLINDVVVSPFAFMPQKSSDFRLCGLPSFRSEITDSCSLSLFSFMYLC